MPPLPRATSSSVGGSHVYDSSEGVKAGAAAAAADDNLSLVKPKGAKAAGVSDWGFPGHLTEAEFSVYEQFRSELYKRDQDFQRTVFTFKDAGEHESYALCRWLRARKFKLPEVLSMIQDATDCRAEPSRSNFYSDPQTALGVEPAIYLSQYPQLHCGYTKSGCPYFISKPGVLNVSGIECIATIEGIVRYHWFDMANNFLNTLRSQNIRDPVNFKRYECVCVIDLANLSASNVTKRALNIVKVQSQIDSICFPETLNKMYIINAPSFFAMTWKIIKGYVDARTATKVEIISSRKKWEKVLKEVINVDELPCDYGGSGENTNERLNKFAVKLGHDEDLKRVTTDVISVRSSGSILIELSDKEVADIVVFTRSMSGGTVSVTSPKGTTIIDKYVVKHKGKGTEQEEPTRVTLKQKLQGPGNYKVKIDSCGGPFYTEHFLVAGKIYPTVRKSKNGGGANASGVPPRQPRSAAVAMTDGTKLQCEEKKNDGSATANTPPIPKHRSRSSDDFTSLVDVSLSSPAIPAASRKSPKQDNGARCPSAVNASTPNHSSSSSQNRIPSPQAAVSPPSIMEYETVDSPETVGAEDVPPPCPEAEATCGANPLAACGGVPSMSYVMALLSDPFAKK